LAASGLGEGLAQQAAAEAMAVVISDCLGHYYCANVMQPGIS